MKVKKSTKRFTPPPADAARLIELITQASDQDLPDVLSAFKLWRYPRGDLHGWIPVLDRFDDILAETITSYDLSKIQINDFTPQTKTLVLEVLRVLKLLLENCTSRKLFSSYDRLCDLLLTHDLEILHATLSLLMRPAQTYASQIPIDKVLNKTLKARLITLAKGSDILRSNGLNLKALSGQGNIPLPDGVGSFQVTFYPTQQPSDKPAASGSSQLTIDPFVEKVQDHISEEAEKNFMSVEDQLETHNKVRWILSLKDEKERQELVAIRLMAIAELWFVSADDNSQSALFLYEPDLIIQISDLFGPSIPEPTQAAAIAALDGCIRSRSRLPDVLTAIGANLSHGSLMSLFRRVVNKLAADEPVSHDIVDAAMSFISFISMSHSHGTVLAGAGAVPLLLEMLKTNSERRDNYIPRATGLIDAFGSSTTNNAEWIHTLVERVKAEIDHHLNAILPEPTETLSHDSIIFCTTAPLKAVLRSLHRIMHSGVEGSRNMVDTDLPKLLKLIFRDQAKFGHRVFAQAINIMASFVHNEPTSLSILQEQQLPQTLFEVLENEIPDSFEVMSAVSSAIGAACLNTAGLEYVGGHPNVLTNLVNASIHLNESGQEHIQHMGAALDELSRHHPTLRPTILEAVNKQLQEAIDAGKAFVPPEEEAVNYSFENVENPKTVTNKPMTDLAKVIKLLDGLLGNTSLCKDFIEGGLDLILQIPNLPCIPVAYVGTDLHSATTSLFRVVGEYDHVKLLDKVNNSIKRDLEDSRSLWQPSTTDWTDNEDVRKLPGAAIRLSYIADIMASMSFHHARTATALMRSFGATSGSSFVADVASLHRASFREHAKFRVPPKATTDLATALLGLDEATNTIVKTSAQFLATRVHAVCTKLFKAMIRLLFTKRGGDAAHRKESEALATQISKDIIEHLQSSPSPVADTAAIGLATILLFDERGPEGRLNTVLFLAFHKAGGVKALLALADKIVSRMDGLPETTDDKDEAAKEEVSKATAGLRLVLVVISGLVSPYSLVDSPQTHALLSGSDTWSPHDILVQIRLDALPLVHRIWSASWLPTTPVPVIKAAAKAFLTIMDGQSEIKSESVPAPVAHVVQPPIVRAPLTADPARVDQLVDMGFARGAAEQALVRARNNIMTATDLILSMPHIFQDAPTEGEANQGDNNEEDAENNNGPNDADQERTEGGDAGQASNPEGEQTAPTDIIETDETAASNEGEAPAASENAETQPTDAPATETETAMEVDVPPAVPIRERLDALRSSYKGDIGSRALTLLDSAEDLVFDLISAFPSGMEGVKALLGHALQGVQDTSDKRDNHLSSRLRMLAIFMRQVEDISLDVATQQNVVDIITPLKIETSPRPKWACALMIFAEAAFAASDAITVTKIGEEPIAVTMSAETLDTAVAPLTELINTILLDNDSSRDELISALRLFVVISRRRRDIITPDFLKTVLAPFKVPAVKLSGCQPYISMIVRHAFEDQDTLVSTMRREIRMYLTRNKVTDVNHFIRQMRQTAARDPAAFIIAVEKECTLNDPSPAQSVYHVRALPETTTVESDPFSDSHDDSALLPIMDLLVGELGVAVQTEGSHTYGGTIVSLLTEILGSYVAPKRVFVTSLRKQGLFPGSKGGLATVINEIICKVGLTDLEATHNAKNPTESSRRLMLSSWSTSMLVALSCDPGGDLKEDAEALATVRKNLLDVVAKAIKETAPSDPNARYGRLFALGELVYGLLLVRSGPAARQIDPASMQIAKIMLEKSFVSLLTAASGEVDLNYPGVRLVLGSLLRALDHLTKVSIKWSKSEKSNKKTVSESESEPESDDYMDMDSEDEDEEGADVEAPDLYMNSSLGMNRVDEDDSEDGEGDEDDEMMDEYDEEMDITDDDSNTEPSTDEDDEDQEGWMDEEMDGDEEDEMEDGPDVVIGDADVMDDDQWDDVIEGDEDEDSEGDPEMMDEMYPDEEGLFDDIGEELDIDDMDEDELEEMEMMEARMPGGSGTEFGAADPGHWGWEQGGESAQPESRRSRMLDPDRAAAALLGLPSRNTPSGAPAQPALIAQPTAETSTRRRDATTRGELFAALQGMGGSHAVQLMETLLHRSEQAGAEAIRISFAPNDSGTIDITVGNRSFNIPNTSQRGQEPAPNDLAAECVPKPSNQRWLEEMKLAPIQNKDYNARLVVHLVNRLLPEAKKREAEEEAKRQKEEAEVAEREKKEEEEEAAKQKKEEMAGLETAAGVELPASRATPIAADRVETGQPAGTAETGPGGDIEMDVTAPARVQAPADAPQAEAPSAEALIAQLTRDLLANTQQLQQMVPQSIESAAPEAQDAPVEAPVPEGSLARTIVSVRGHNVDITDTGIDLEFLQALPEDMRADVIEQHLREQTRARQPPPPNVPADLAGISPEFLDALPPDIRREVIAQQAMESARHQRPAAEAPAPDTRDVSARAGGNAGAEGRPVIMRAPRPLMGDAPDTAFLNTLPEELRDVMMMDTGDAMEAMGAMMGMRRPKITKAEPKRDELRDSIQLLEKPGIASLTRLLFFPEAFKKDRLFRILANLCENSTTRSDLLNLLLSVLQDGSGDLPLVDRSFQQMSIKTMATPAKSASKVKAAESPAPFTTSNLFSHLQTDNIPTFIAQRCLEALTYILGCNSQSVNFFLTEHEQGVGLKKPAGRKGKGKEKVLPQTKFPVVILLGLLDRTALLSTPGVMESLTALLVTVTKPLATLKVQKEEAKDGEQSTDASAVAAPPQGSAVAQTPGPTSNAASTQTPAAPAASSSKTTENAAKGALTRFPIIPTSALRLVVNCLTTGECSSRNFSQTAVVLQNLSCIPEAQKTILQELQDRSQKLGQELQQELQTLSVALGDESFETSNPALTVFSSPAANQAQLLRLLKTIEYLHLNKVDSDPPGEVMTEQEQAVSKIYQSFDFDPMWNHLRHCLTLVEERDDTKQIALVLLPLVEALMVVCKYRRNPSREVRSPSAPPSSATSAADNSDLFLSFTTHHRKVLNTIVRTTPALLSGSFSLLIHNPRVLEFDNKRQWFFQKLKKKRDQIAAGSLNLSVRRQYVFQDSFDALRHKTGNEIKYGKIGVKFHGEDGIDAGGVTREWYSVLAQQIFDPNFALFEPCAADKQTYQPNKASAVVNESHIAYFKFIGRIIGKAVYDGRLLDAYFNRAFYKQILGRTVDMRDLESIDPEYHKSLQWMLENDITGVIDQEFTIEDEQFGEKVIVELKEGGASIPVTEENKEEYVRLVVSYRLDNSIKDQIKAFLDGFYEIIPRNLIQIFEPDQLELLISGMSSIDVDELRNATQVSGWKSSDPEIGWFWRALRSFSQEERSRFLMFVTSSSRVPLGGFTQLIGASGIQPFQLQKLYSKEGSLPQASTCFNLLLLPQYSSYEQLRERLQFAVTETGGFGKS